MPPGELSKPAGAAARVCAGEEDRTSSQTQGHIFSSFNPFAAALSSSSPVERYETVDLFLEDEGQQYGNMEEAASVNRTPTTGLEVW